MNNKFNWKILVALGFIVLVLAGCSHGHKPLEGVYYGYYSDQDPQQFVILAFDKAHPGSVAIRQNIDGIKTNNVFLTKYIDNSLIIEAHKAPVEMQITNKGHVLICYSCDGKSLPKIYVIGATKNKVFSSKVSQIAFDDIEQKSKTILGNRLAYGVK